MFRISIALFSLIGVSLFLTGLLYLTLDEFMPYHAEALQLHWDDLEANHQGLLLGFLKGLGSGAFIAGFAVLFMAAACLRKNPRPFMMLLPAIAIGYPALLCYATYTVYTSTPGRPPLFLNIVLVATSVLASALLAGSRPARARE